MMTIDPRVGFYFSLFLAIVSYMSGAAAVLTDILGAERAHLIVALSLFFLGIGNSINVVLHAIPSQSTSDPKIAKEFYLGPKAT